MQGFRKFFDNGVNWKFHHFAKIHLARQFGHRKLLQPGKDQYLPSAVLW
jgi:hypothetical protein